MNISPRLAPTPPSSYLRTLLIAWLVICAAFLATPARADVTYTPLAGWNILGNSSDQPINVANIFGDPNQVTTVWKWDRNPGQWAFYSPTMTSAELIAYAQAKGYNLLIKIYPTEGFWVNKP